MGSLWIYVISHFPPAVELSICPHFSTDQDEIWCGNVIIQVERPDSLLSMIYVIKVNDCIFTNCLKKL